MNLDIFLDELEGTSRPAVVSVTTLDPSPAERARQKRRKKERKEKHQRYATEYADEIAEKLRAVYDALPDDE